MIEEFDKEIDALLRQAAQGAVASAVNNLKSETRNSKPLHLDADEISLFAENALPSKLRENAVVHFADCERCRRILSDLIAETPADESVSAGQIEVFAPAIPWYRKPFAFPNLAYTLGALVLVFSGLVAFTIVQSVDKAKNTEVSKISERPIGAPGMSSDGESVIVEKENVAASKSSNSMSSNSMPSASMSNSASASSANTAMSNSAMNSAARNLDANPAPGKSAAANKSSVSANESPKEPARSEEVTSQKSISDLPIQGRVANNLTEERRRVARQEEDKKTAETTDAVKSDAEKSAAPPQPKPETPSVSDDAVTATALRAKPKKLSRAPNVETSSIGGKTFKRAGNVWVDAAYNNQPTIGVTRGTKEYKKLDSSLRGIVENLGGTVIVVWKDKAYRIQ